MQDSRSRDIVDFFQSDFFTRVSRHLHDRILATPPSQKFPDQDVRKKKIYTKRRIIAIHYTLDNVTASGRTVH